MKRKTSILLVFIVSLFGVTWFYLTAKKDISLKLVYQFDCSDKLKGEFPPIVSHDISNMNYILFKWISDSLTNKQNIDFTSNDYIVTFGRELKKAYIYKFISNPLDNCSYAEYIPLGIDLDDHLTPWIYFYQIDKGKFRSICP